MLEAPGRNVRTRGQFLRKAAGSACILEAWGAQSPRMSAIFDPFCCMSLTGQPIAAHYWMVVRNKTEFMVGHGATSGGIHSTGTWRCVVDGRWNFTLYFQVGGRIVGSCVFHFCCFMIHPCMPSASGSVDVYNTFSSFCFPAPSLSLSVLPLSAYTSHPAAATALPTHSVATFHCYFV